MQYQYSNLLAIAQDVSKFNVCVQRSELYDGNLDSYCDEFRNRPTDEKMLVDIFSRRTNCLFNYAQGVAQRRETQLNPQGARNVEIKPILVYQQTLNEDGEIRKAVGELVVENPPLKSRVEQFLADDTGSSDFGCVREDVSHKGVLRYVIWIFAHNRCWARYMLAKELSHVITGTVVDVKDGGVHSAVALLKDSENWRQRIKDADSLIKGEAVGVYLALEIMLPYFLRQRDSKNTIACDIGEISKLAHLARRFMLPELLLTCFFYDPYYGRDLHGYTEGRYSGFSHRMNDEISQKIEFYPLPSWFRKP